ncbi:MAG: AEC family transporter [Clostridia bacterium]|nr:AEC family transporter [Clostridia bacterium]
MLILFAFIAIGYILAKTKILPDNSATVLSKLENYVFVPALVMSTFIKNFTTDNIGNLWKIIVFSIILLVALLPITFIFAKLLCKEEFIRKIAIYGLEFSNFGFMGNAIVKGVFPELFFNYTIFTLPFWFLIYAWGVPVLLISSSGGNSKGTVLKNFINPMLIAMVIGMIIGLSGLGGIMPYQAVNAIDLLGDCMSPIAMILTGATVASANVIKLLRCGWLYGLSAVKLIIYPLIYILCVAFIPKGGFLTETMLICGMCMVSMPMGLNSIVVPAAYGKDTSQAAALAIITHLLSIVTIPLVFLLFNAVVI